VVEDTPIYFLQRKCRPKNLFFGGISFEECGVSLQPIPEFPLRHSSKFNKNKIHTHTLYFSTDFIICPIAIAYSMAQIIKSVCVCQSVSQSVCQYICLSVCEHSHGRISSSIFTQIGTDVSTPKRKNEFVRVNIALPLPYFAPQNPHFRPKGPENPCKY